MQKSMAFSLQLHVFVCFCIFWIQADITCLDHQTQCDDGSTCCQMTDDEWGCCPMPNAVCCQDKIHCCPESTRCDLIQKKCLQSDGQVLVMSMKRTKKVNNAPRIVVPWLKKLAAFPSTKNTTVRKVNCDIRFSCDDGQTCCKIKSDKWGCCPMPRATCCKDKIHCCPKGTTCKTAEGTCIQNGMESTDIDFDNAENFEWTRILPATKNEKSDEKSNAPFFPTYILSTNVRNVELKEKSMTSCGHGPEDCESQSTCCPFANGTFGCCPYQNGQCCKDKQSCCPPRSQCDATSKLCRTDDDVEFQSTTLLPPYKKEYVPCDNGFSCPARGKCCSNVWNNIVGCCPHSDGHCCPSGRTCCPKGYVCKRDDTCLKA